jgi:hypothetical protein
MNDELAILRALLEAPSKLRKKRLTELQLEGWRLLSSPSEDTEYWGRVSAISRELFDARKRKRGGQLGVKDQYYFANDRLVFEKMVAGETQASAIAGVYGDDPGGVHRKRIQRRKAEMLEWAELITAPDRQ